MDEKHLSKLVSGLFLSREQRSTFAPHLSQMTTLIESPSFEQSFTELATTYERIKFVLSHKAVRRLIANLISLVHNSRDNKKCTTQTCQLIEDGAGALKAGRNENALAICSSAIRCAPQDSVLLPLALGTRCSVFFQLKQYEAALKDIEAAQSHPKYKQNLIFTIRKCECLIRLGRAEQAWDILDPIEQSDLNDKDSAMLHHFYLDELVYLKDCAEKFKVEQVGGKSKEKDKFEPELLKNVSSVIKILSEKGRFEPQSNGSSLSSKVEVRYDEKNGRHLVTTQDVKFGDILAVTKPYAAVLTQKQELHFCHHCLTSLKPISNKIYPHTPIPCTQCSCVLYCSEHCRTESWQSYHRFECQLFPNSFEMAIGDHGRDYRLALRTLFVAGGLDRVRAVTQKFPTTSDPSKSADFTHNPADFYENVYRMEMKMEDGNIKELIKTIIKVAFLVKWSKLGESEYEGSASPNITIYNIFAISTLLRHYLQIRSNYSFFVRRDQSALDEPTVPSELIYTLDPLISLVRKSHHPNISINVIDCATKSAHLTNVCAFFALKPMPAGTVLSMAFPLYGDYRADVESFVRFRKELRPKLACPCEHCRIDEYEFVSCGESIRQTEDDDQANCCTGKLEIGVDEFVEMKMISLDISKFHSEANVQIGRIKTLIENDEQVLANLPKTFCTLLVQLETLINDRIAPLALKHRPLLLVDLYKQLNVFYRFGYFTMESDNKFPHLQKAWKYAEASHTTLERHFGGGSLDLLVLLQKNVRFFSKEIGVVIRGLMEPVEQKPGQKDGSSLKFSLNLNDDTEDESRKARICLIQSFNAAQKRLDRMYERYKMI